MLKVSQRGGRLYIEGSHNGERIRKSTGLGPADKAIAEKQRDIMMQRLVLGQPIDSGELTFGELADSYLSRPQGVSKGTRYNVEILLRWWKKVRVPTPMPMPVMIEQYLRDEWYDGDQPKVQSSTMRRAIIQLRAVYGHAAETGRIEAVPVIPLPAGGEGRERFLTLEEIELLVSTAKTATPAIYPLIVFLLQTGARLGEAMEAVWPGPNSANAKAQVMLEAKNPYVAIVSRKGSGGKRIRHVPLHQDTVEVLKALPHRTGHVFLSTWGKKWGGVNSIHHHWTVLLEQTGIEGIVPHDLRRTYASHLIMNGADLRTVQKLLGHTSLVMLDKHYGHLANSQLIVGASKVYSLGSVTKISPPPQA